MLLSDVEQVFVKASRDVEQAERDRAERRRKQQLRLSRIAVTVVTGLLLGTVYLYARATQERNRALAQKLATDSVLLRGLNVDWTAPALLAIESLRRSESLQVYEALWVASSVLPRELVQLPAPAGKSRHSFGTTMRFSPDGATLAVGTDDPLVRLFDAKSAREVAQLPLVGDVRQLAFSPDAALVAVGMTDGPRVRIVELVTGRELAKVDLADVANVLTFSRDGKYLAIGGHKRTTVHLASTGDAVALFPAVEGVRSLAFSPDGILLAVGDRDNTMRMFDVQVGFATLPGAVSPFLQPRQRRHGCRVQPGRPAIGFRGRQRAGADF